MLLNIVKKLAMKLAFQLYGDNLEGWLEYPTYIVNLWLFLNFS